MNIMLQAMKSPPVVAVRYLVAAIAVQFGRKEELPCEFQVFELTCFSQVASSHNNVELITFSAHKISERPRDSVIVTLEALEPWEPWRRQVIRWRQWIK
jgi:hypothetical protein